MKTKISKKRLKKAMPYLRGSGSSMGMDKAEKMERKKVRKDKYKEK